jgi:hypothetical protein
MGTMSKSASHVAFRALQLITRQMVRSFLRKQTARLHSLLTIGGLVAAFASPPAHAQAMGPCAQVRMACEQAGFVRGGVREGIGLQIDCVRPIMQGTPQRPNASKPLPPIDPQLIAACKLRNPNFGQPQGSSSGPLGQPRGPGQTTAAPQPPGPAQTSPAPQQPDSGQSTQPQAAGPPGSALPPSQ